MRKSEDVKSARPRSRHVVEELEMRRKGGREKVLTFLTIQPIPRRFVLESFEVPGSRLVLLSGLSSRRGRRDSVDERDAVVSVGSFRGGRSFTVRVKSKLSQLCMR